MILAFWLASAACWAIVIVAAKVQRGGLYARFAAILVGVHTLISCSLARHVGPLLAPYAALQFAVYLHFFFLARPKMRPLAYRVFISLPASFFAASTLLALPWSLAAAFGLTPHALALPYVLGLIGIVQSLTSRREEIDLLIDGAHVEGIRRHPLTPGTSGTSGSQARESKPLRLVQISDPHLGPFMSVARLRAICERAVARNPDLVLLTGDFLTMESQGDPELLFQALEPLRALEGRVFACFGNHDHEAPRHVVGAMKRIGATLLIDEATVVETAIGPVQIVGMDFHFGGRKEKMAEVCANNPRIPDVFRLVLLHDPGAFRHLGEGEGDLVLSGHTHGGQLGLLSLGAPHTFLRLFVDMPDHGLWARGPDRLYVHRGTGHYGFPLRLGVPAEESELRVHRA